jgi:hypothetical protein
MAEKSATEQDRHSPETTLAEIVRAGKMNLWKECAETDPKNTKEVRFGKRKFTAISAYYQIRQMTRIFGPCGYGWGFDIEDEQMCFPEEKGAYLRLKVRLWYGNRNTYILAYGAEKLWAKQNETFFLDEDAWKKALTDGLTKAMSLMGMSADVFMGLYDDNKYVSRMRREYENRDDTDEVNGHAQPEATGKPEPTPEPTPEPEVPVSARERLGKYPEPPNEIDTVDVSALVPWMNEQAEVFGAQNLATAYLKERRGWETMGDLRKNRPYLQNLARKIWKLAHLWSIFREEAAARDLNPLAEEAFVAELEELASVQTANDGQVANVLGLKPDMLELEIRKFFKWEV